MHYADSSFLVSLFTIDAATAAVTNAYRAMKRPVLIFGPLHEMEVRNTIRCLQFAEALQLPASKRALCEAKRLRSEARLAGALRQGFLVSKPVDWTILLDEFEHLSALHTTHLGARTLDILHVAAATKLHCKNFITCDNRQATLAKAAGLQVTLVKAIG